MIKYTKYYRFGGIHMSLKLALSFMGAELGWSHLFLFLIGLGAGAVIMVLVYLLILATSLKTPKMNFKVDEKKFTPEEFNLLVEKKQNEFKEKAAKKPALTQVGICKDVTTEAITEIAKKFYPKSKHPMLELNVSELLVLNRQVTERLEGLFNKPVIRWLRKIKVSQIVGAYDLKKKLDENEPLQKILDFGKEASGIMKLFRWNKPTTWVGFGLGKLLDLVASKICLAAISFASEESYKIYSKKFMIEDVDVDTGADKLLDDVELPKVDALPEGDVAKV